MSTDISEEVLINRLGSLCKKELAENQIPYKYEIVKEFPRTGAGKIDYRKLEEL